MKIEKGNIVRSKKHDTTAIVLALTRDGRRAKVYVYGPDEEVWRPLSTFTVEHNGIETCWKCGGSGQFHSGGGTLNGVFTGTIGVCFGCEGKGKQNNADRLRNHYYWHRQTAIYNALDAIERGEEPEPISAPWQHAPEDNGEGIKATVERVRSGNKRHNHPDPERKALGKPKRKRAMPAGELDHLRAEDDGVKLINCQQCGCMHRADVSCPWGEGRTA
jgi:hypothetical protein